MRRSFFAQKLVRSLGKSKSGLPPCRQPLHPCALAPHTSVQYSHLEPNNESFVASRNGMKQPFPGPILSESKLKQSMVIVWIQLRESIRQSRKTLETWNLKQELKSLHLLSTSQALLPCNNQAHSEGRLPKACKSPESKSGLGPVSSSYSSISNSICSF